MQASDLLAKLHAQSQPLPKLTDLFSTGQLVRCTITGLEQQSRAQTPSSKSAKGAKKSVHLSSAVSKVNAGLSAETLQEGLALPACVTSIEDHGYSLSFGVKGTNGFLPKKVHAKAYGSASVLKPGMLVECVVTSAANRRLVKVTTDPEALSEAIVSDFEGLHIGKLLSKRQSLLLGYNMSQQTLIAFCLEAGFLVWHVGSWVKAALEFLAKACSDQNVGLQ